MGLDGSCTNKRNGDHNGMDEIWIENTTPQSKRE
jgi:hypothetical protein